jgi:hypothetical protein
VTWTTTKSNGSGTLSYRLHVQGCPYGFVTHWSMVKPAATPPRIGGLKVSGAKIKCVSNIASGELQVSGLSVSLVDLQEQATLAFGKAPTSRTWLTAACSSAATSMAVRSTAGFGTSGSLWLDSEAITYSSRSAAGFAGLTRGALSTVAQSHYIDGGGSLRFPMLTNLPRTLTGRRATLYVYGEQDDPQGDGTQIFRGIVSRAPTQRGSAWSLSIDPISSVLTRAVGADLGEPLSPRGIYYPWNRPFAMTLFLGATALPGEPGDSGLIRFPVAAGDTAFFETQDDFVTYLNTKIATETSGWATTVVAVSDGDDGWHLEATTDATPKAVWALGPGGVDPIFLHPQNPDGTPIIEFLASTIHRFYGTAESLPGAGTVPRGYVGQFQRGTSTGIPALNTTFPARRIYIGGVASLSSFVDAVSVEFSAFGDEAQTTMSGEATPSVSPRFLAFNAERTAEVTNLYSRGFTSAALPKIRLGRTYASGGSVWTAINAIIAAQAAEINAGSVPDLQSGDFDSTSWSELDATWQPRIVRSRTFTSFVDVPLVDLVREELKLAGYALGLSATGTLAIFRLRRPVTTEAGATSILSLKIDKGLPTWDPNGAGLVNTVKIRRGYAPIDDDFVGPTAVVRDVAAFGSSPRPYLLTIEPKSFPSDGQETNAECVEVTARIVSVLGFDYAIVMGDVGLRHFDSCIPGAVVSITSPHLANASDGTRGVSAMPALVVGREVDLDAGRISCTFYVPLSRASGYSPGAKLTGNSSVAGNTYDLTCDTYTFPSGTDAEDWFVVGDRVRVFRWDSTTAGTLVGTVVSGGAGGNVRRVTFDGAWTPGADTWRMGFAVSTDASLVSTQLRFVVLADSAGRIDAATDLDAWGFG